MARLLLFTAVDGLSVSLKQFGHNVISYETIYIDGLYHHTNYLISEQENKTKMIRVTKAVIRMSYNSVPVELSIEAYEDDEIKSDDIKEIVDEALSNGLTKPVAFERKESNEGKKGTVKTVVFMADSKMYAVTSVLDDGKEFVWKEFSKSAFRIGDRIKVIKNDRGFFAGQLIDNEEEPSESDETATKQTDIPF